MYADTIKSENSKLNGADSTKVSIASDKKDNILLTTSITLDTSNELGFDLSHTPNVSNKSGV